MQGMSANINVIMKAIDKVRGKLVRDFGEVEKLQVSKKAPGDFVSSTDLHVEKKVVEELQRARSSYSFLLEEAGDIVGENKSLRWIVDPLDGTTNFIHGVPVFCITIALEQTLADGSKEILAAVTDNPIHRETFYTEKGAGAWMTDANGHNHRLRVAARDKLEESIVTVGSLKSDIDFAANFPTLVSGIRCTGSTALSLAYVAAGRFDVFYQKAPKTWDIAAGILLVKEAGGVIKKSDGTKRTVDMKGDLIASNEDLSHKVIAAIK